MNSLLFPGGIVICAGLALGQNPAPNPAPRPLIDQYCVTCHNQRAKTAGLMLDKMDPAHVAQDREAWEKVVRKLRAGMMPPQGMPRPNDATYEALTVTLENELDRAAAQKPKLSTPGMHRLNRTEYANAIRELVGLDIDPAVYLPADDSSYGFDNVESGLQVSPALVEGYVSAAAKLSRVALGHETAPGRKIYYTREDYSQEDQVEGLPFGTRGGLLVRHYFPSDGEYIISWVPVRNTVGALYGGDSDNAQIELSVDGTRIKLYQVGKDIPLASNVQADKNEVRVPLKAYRRPLTEADVNALMNFYHVGRETGDFEYGIEKALQFILAHPEFIFRTETAPAGAKPGEAYRVSDLELASRLSFFLWSNLPDEELINLAAQGRLKDPNVLQQQVARMLRDQRSHELVKNFAGQSLGLRTLQNETPEGTIYPDFDDNLRQAMRTETEMFFDSILREGRSVLELLTADYTFVNERLAVHYGIPNVYGSQVRRVKLDAEFDVRRGLLGKGSFELATSNSDRTSPVLRGKWILENLLGTHPPDPPPNVPPLKPNPAAGPQTMRQRMEEHRANPACSSCHRMMDPIGFALETFDGTGKWRTREAGQRIDASGQLVDGSPLKGVVSLRDTLVRYSPQFVRTLTEKLLTYGLGRGVDYDDMPTVRSIVRESGRNDYRLSTIVMEIVRSAPFQMNRKAIDVAERR